MDISNAWLKFIYWVEIARCWYQGAAEVASMRRQQELHPCWTQVRPSVKLVALLRRHSLKRKKCWAATVREKIQLYPLSNGCNTQHGPQAPLLLPETSVLQSTEMMSTGFVLGLLAKTQTCIFKSFFYHARKHLLLCQRLIAEKPPWDHSYCLIINYGKIFGLHI